MVEHFSMVEQFSYLYLGKLANPTKKIFGKPKMIDWQSVIF